MSHDSPWCRESKFYCFVGELTMLLSVTQILTSTALLIIIFMSRDIDGFSINFQVLYTIALVFKYLDDYKVEHLESSAALDSIFKMQYWTKTYSSIGMILTIFVTVYFAKHDKWDIWWNAGGIIVSLVFALDHFSFDLTARDRWMIGSYMDIIAWITLFKFFRTSRTNNSESYIILMFFDHLFKFFFTNYDNYRDKLYGNVGYKLNLLKVLLYCCFIVHCIEHYTKSTNEVTETNISINMSFGSSEPPVRDTTRKSHEKPAPCTEKKKVRQTRVNMKLMAPNQSI